MKKTPLTPIKKTLRGTVQKNKVQTTIMGSIDSNLLIVFKSGKKFPAPFSKQFLEDNLCVPGVAHWKKKVQTKILDSIDSTLLLIAISEKKSQPPFQNNF